MSTVPGNNIRHLMKFPFSIFLHVSFRSRLVSPATHISNRLNVFTRQCQTTKVHHWWFPRLKIGKTPVKPGSTWRKPPRNVLLAGGASRSSERDSIAAFVDWWWRFVFRAAVFEKVNFLCGGARFHRPSTVAAEAAALLATFSFLLSRTLGRRFFFFVSFWFSFWDTSDAKNKKRSNWSHPSIMRSQ